MKQTVIFTRTETIEVEMEVIQALSKETLEGFANAARPFGTPAGYTTISQRLEPWQAKRIEPRCECVDTGQGVARKHSRKKRG